MRLRLFLVVVSITAAAANFQRVLGSTVVEDTNIILNTDTLIFQSDYNLTTIQDIDDPTSVLFSVDASEVPGFAALTFDTTNVDEGSDWYLAEFGQTFSASSIDSGTQSQWGGELPDGQLLLGETINVAFGEFYLGVNTGVGFGDIGPNRNIFGWAHFSVNDMLELEIIDNAVAYDSGQIIVGRNSAFAFDFDGSGNIDTADADLLQQAIVGGGTDLRYDVDGDESVSPADLNAFVTLEAGTFIGDLDLSKTVDSTDLGLLLNGFGDSIGVQYTSGDVDASGTVDSTDLGLLLNGFGDAASFAAVPEPNCLPLFVFAAVFVVATRIKRRRLAH